MADLTANSSLSRADLERFVPEINEAGLGWFVWDRQRDLVQDGRLRHEAEHSEECAACGAKVTPSRY